MSGGQDDGFLDRLDPVEHVGGMDVACDLFGLDFCDDGVDCFVGDGGGSVGVLRGRGCVFEVDAGGGEVGEGCAVHVGFGVVGAGVVGG